MPKKASCGKKGIVQRIIPKHRIHGKRPGSQEAEDKRKETKGAGGCLGLSAFKYTSYGPKCFDIILKTCEKFHLIGFKRTSSGQYVLLDGRDQMLHYAAIALYVAVCLQKTLVTLDLLLREELRIGSFMCLAMAGGLIIAGLMGLGLITRPKETTDMLNSWSYLPRPLHQTGPVKASHPLDDNLGSIKAIMCFLLAQAGAACPMILSIAMSDLPVFLFPMAERLGLLPDGILSRLAWQITFAPLEWLTYLPASSIAIFSVSVLFLGTGAVSMYLKPLGLVRVRSVRSRHRLEQMYIQLDLFSGIFRVWIRSFFPTWLLGMASGTIVFIFIAIRYTELPLLVYLEYPYGALTALIVIFWQSYDMIRVTRGSEDILGVLLDERAAYLKYKPRGERAEILKRAKAMRPLGFRIGDCQFSMNVPINTWDEVLNQVVFLLSL